MCISSLIWNLSCTIVYNKHTTKLRLIDVFVSYTFFSHNSFICCLLFYLTYYNVGSLYAFLYEKGNVHNYRPMSVTCSIQTFWYLFSDNLCKQYANFHSFAQTLRENTPLDDEWMKIIFFCVEMLIRRPNFGWMTLQNNLTKPLRFLIFVKYGWVGCIWLSTLGKYTKTLNWFLDISFFLP